MDVFIRKGKEEDLPKVLELVKELAHYERAPHEVINTVELMKKDGFGPNPIFGFEVAENDGSIIGAAIYYTRYSTWKGRKLYLEDLIVTEKERGNGAGQLLFNRCVEIAREQKCHSMEWQVLDWNEPAINFYEKYNAEFDRGWIDCSLRL